MMLHLQIPHLEEELDMILQRPVLSEVHNNAQDITATAADECILRYLGGYIAMKLSNEPCSNCVASLHGPEEATGLIRIRTHGGLATPSARLAKLLKTVEAHVQNATTDCASSSSMYHDIIGNCFQDERLSQAAVGCEDHFVQKTAEVLHFFVKCRLHFFTRETNKKFRESKPRSSPASGGRKAP